MNPYSIPFLISSIVTLLMGIFVFLKGPKSPVNRAFALMCLGFLDWQICAFLMYYLQSDIQKDYLARIGYTLILFLPFNIYHFTVGFLNKKSEIKWVFGFYLAGLVWLILLWTTNYFIAGSIEYSWGYYAKAGPLHPLYLVFVAVAFGRTLFLLGKSLLDKSRSVLAKNQSRFILIAIAVIYTAGFEYLINYGYDIYPIGSFFIFAAYLIIAYAIVKYHLMDITLVIKRGFSYATLLALVFVPLYLLTLSMQNWFYGQINIFFSIALLSLFIVTATVLYHVKAIIERGVEKTFFRAKYDAYKILKKFGEELITIIDLQDLLDYTIKTFVKTFKIEKASIILFDEKRERFTIHASHGLSDELISKTAFKKDDHCIAWLLEKRKIIVTEELERDIAKEDIKKIWDNLRLIGSELCIPFIYQDQLIGLCNLSAKGDRSMYNHEDIELFLSLGKQASIAIKNAQLIEQIKESKQVIRRIDRLKTIGDLAAGFAHEIRNPLVPIKTCLQLLPARYGKDPDFTEKIPKYALQEVERIEKLLREIMDYSRPRTPVFAEEDINEVIEGTVRFIEYQAKKKGIKIDRGYDNALPRIKVDREQMKQVLLNLIMNAIDAVHPVRGSASSNGVKIEVATRKIEHLLSPSGKIGKGEYVQIEITDNGVGIPKENLDRIFNPFYTTKHESSDGREGTGLGLSIVHEIVSEHCGFVDVRSEMGVGSSFYVNLPVETAEPEEKTSRRGEDSKIR